MDTNSASLIIPQHQFSELTLQAVATFRQTHGSVAEIVVVDDGSRPCRQSLLQKSRLENLTIVRMPRRKGVTAAWNLGAAAARGKILVFLNNDTLSEGTWLERVQQQLQEPPTKILGPCWRNSSQLGRRLTHQPRFLEGWMLGLTRETFEQLGGFDERFTMYFSDTDLQWRALRRWEASLRVSGPLAIHHAGHASTRHWKQRSVEWCQDRNLFLRKWS